MSNKLPSKQNKNFPKFVINTKEKQQDANVRARTDVKNNAKGKNKKIRRMYCMEN